MADIPMKDMIDRLDSAFPELEVHRIDAAISIPHAAVQRRGWNIILMNREPVDSNLDRDLTQSMLKMAALVGIRTLGDSLLKSPLFNEEQKEIITEVMKTSIDSAEEEVSDAVKDDATRQ